MPRKTVATPAARRRAPVASMRPRPDAAENERQQARRLGGGPASMRPRPDAAENPRRVRVRSRSGRASMRPRPDAAENGAWSSMRALPEGVLQ